MTGRGGNGTAPSSGIQLLRKDARMVLGMLARGDREHDIAAWFGVNQGRIKEVKDGAFGTLSPAPEADLPPTGAPGLKARQLIKTVNEVCEILAAGDASRIPEATEKLQRARDRFYKNE